MIFTELFQRKKPKWLKKIHEEMLNIPDRKENANQDHVKISLHSWYNDYHEEHKQQQMLVRI
jgi:hypothetical protein